MAVYMVTILQRCIVLLAAAICLAPPGIHAADTAPESWTNALPAARAKINTVRMNELESRKKLGLDSLTPGGWWRVDCWVPRSSDAARNFGRTFEIDHGKIEAEFLAGGGKLDITRKRGRGIGTFAKTDFADGKVYDSGFPQVRSLQAAVLYREIQAKRDMIATAHLGFSGGLKVLLNGKELMAVKLARPGRPAGPNQAKVPLPLKKGKNYLLIKITADDVRYTGFYFSLLPKTGTLSVTEGLMKQLAADYPLQYGWFSAARAHPHINRLNASLNVLEYLRGDRGNSLEIGAIRHVLGDSHSGKLDKLIAAKRPAGDKAWLELFGEACRARRAANIKRMGVDEVVFVKRKTFRSNHYYTEYFFVQWKPGGGICVLNTKSGKVRRIVTGLEGGTFDRFDISFDAKRIAFAWKKARNRGYRIYEVNVDGTGLKQLTFDAPNEDELRKDRIASHRLTDDMDPCYLPDGGIAFISTRCQYGTLCDAPDVLTTAIMHRMDSGGKNIRPLSNSSVNEATPSLLPDGRIMYTRWEYHDRGSTSVKALWAMKPDGSASSEIYGSNITFPPTMIQGRAIAGVPNHYVMLGAPHMPGAYGSVIRLDMNKPIRTRKPMTPMTPYVKVAHNGFCYIQPGGGWTESDKGRGLQGPLFRDPYPLSKELFLTAHKPAGPYWGDPAAYGLYILNAKGNVTLLHKDREYSCWQPMPLSPRKTPPVLASQINAELAKKNQAVCVVTDVYHGMEGVRRGEVKYIRIVEQVPRPWKAHRYWPFSFAGQEHATVSNSTGLGLRVQHGIVPVEADGSAHFIVPAAVNVSLQALDKNYMSLQSERTYVNYIPGEQRSCIGCHETPESAAGNTGTSIPDALRRAASVPSAQPGDKSAKRVLDFAMDVQPVLDKHCVECHGKKKTEGKLNLTGKMTDLFSVAYESLCHKTYFSFIGENSPKCGNNAYLPPRSLHSHNSILGVILWPDAVKLKEPGRNESARKLVEKHKKLKLTLAEKLKITNWMDTNGQYHGMYWGRKSLRYKGHRNFRPKPTFDRAISKISTIPEKDR
jgi:hypothetical protein